MPGLMPKNIPTKLPHTFNRTKSLDLWLPHNVRLATGERASSCWDWSASRLGSTTVDRAVVGLAWAPDEIATHIQQNEVA